MVPFFHVVLYLRLRGDLRVLYDCAEYLKKISMKQRVMSHKPTYQHSFNLLKKYIQLPENTTIIKYVLRYYIYCIL